ncbi:hypothetical protein [Flexivirga sp.]
MSTVSRPAQRDLGLDAARGVAIAAMVIAHAGPLVARVRPE